VNIILFGFKGCGKTTLGKILSTRLNRPFFDTDHLVETIYYEQTGEELPFREIYRAIGKESYHILERSALEQLMSAKYAIISVGGGLILDPVNAAALLKLGQLVYLKVDKETLKHRMLQGELPAFLDPSDPEGSFEKMYKQRLPLYEKIPSLVVDLAKKPKDQVVLELCALIEQVEMENG
jgi:shikimate kinase